MRSCISCRASIGPDDWKCTSCGSEPTEADGIVDFLDEENFDAAFSEGDYANLERLEAASFWFRSRNELIAWAVQTHFPDARNILEIGCGTGFVLRGLAMAVPGLTLSGSELSVPPLRITRERLPEASLYRFDARAIPFRDEFDLVCAFDVLEHIPDDRLAIQEMTGAMKPGGGILITVPQHPWLWSPPDEYAGHQRRYTRRGLLGKLHGANLKEVLVTSFATTVLPLMAASRLRLRLMRRRYEPTDEHAQAQRLDPILDRLMRLDHSLIRRGRSLQAGGSLLVGAR